MRALPPLIVSLVVLLAGCATTSSSQRNGRSDLDRVLQAGLMMMGEERVEAGGRPYRSDCSGFVEATFAQAHVSLTDPGIDAVSGTEGIFKTLQKRGRVHSAKRPRPGDLAFFHNTWDRNGNKVRDDRFSHVALVESVDDDGTVHLLHFSGGKVKRDVMNLLHPGVARDPDSGDTWNSYLRRGGGKVLAGQLFFRFGRPLPK